MNNITVQVKDKIAAALLKDGQRIVCGNADYTVTFDLDEAWTPHDVKTARFNLSTGGYIEQVFTGNVCPVPVMANQWGVSVGLYAGELHTSTPAFIPCERSIRCDGGKPAEPESPSTYDQIISMLNATGAKVEETEDGALITIQDVHGKTEVVIKNGAPGPQGPQGDRGEVGPAGPQGETGRGISFVEDADANELTVPGVYLCRGNKSNFPGDHNEPFFQFIVIVQTSANESYIDCPTQTLIGPVYDGGPEIFNRVYDSDYGTWSEWYEGVTIPSASIVEEQLADGIPLSKFTNDAGYLTKKRYEKIASIDAGGVSSYTFETPVERAFLKFACTSADEIPPLDVFGVCGATQVCIGRLAKANASSSKKYTCMEFSIDYGFWRGTSSSAWTTSTANHDAHDKADDYKRYLVYAESSYPFLTAIQSTAAFPAGTTLDIWGIPVDEATVAAYMATPATLEELHDELDIPEEL